MSRRFHNPFAAGEDRFLEDLARRFCKQVLPRGGLGIGDDAAVLPGKPTRVVTMDLLVEEQHFRFDLMTPQDLARRALEANLSDLAAMGAKPEAVLLGLAWPAEEKIAIRAAQFLEGLERACRKRQVPLLGGDSVKARVGAATLSITAIGIPHPGGPVLRSGGKPGDILAVTGSLGASGLGLQILLGRIRPAGGPRERRLAGQAVRLYRTPRARLDAAKPLARWAGALIDLSDGLGIDLPRLARASGCGFEVQAAAIPLHPAVFCFLEGMEAPLRQALGGGEDFELLAAIPSRRWERAWRALARAGVNLVPIGRLTPAQKGSWLVTERGREPWPMGGWDPFASGLDVKAGTSVGTNKRCRSHR